MRCVVDVYKTAAAPESEDSDPPDLLHFLKSLPTVKLSPANELGATLALSARTGFIGVDKIKEPTPTPDSAELRHGEDPLGVQCSAI